MSNIRYRQVHLDFHTSEYIPKIAADFNKEEFAETLSNANVNSITCFARCHHGWLYYPSKRFPELTHPELECKNLLLEQIQACYEKGIKVPVYTTVQWDGRIMREHPEWLSVGEDGKFINTQEVPAPHFYHTICLNSDYRQFFIEHIMDIIDVVGIDNLDGIFMDILFQVDCNCDKCKEKMQELHMDAANKKERLKYSQHMLEEFKSEITALIRRCAPGAGIFYNSSHVGPASKASYKDYSHLELESLPSGGWGYDHFPTTGRYARTLGKDMIGMTGKFHTYWGDFHSLKNRAALELECFNMLAMGAGCSIGDQLHPRGTLSKATYELIGQVYESVKQKEPFCFQAKSKKEIAVLTPEEFDTEGEHNLGISPSLIGAVRMLSELSYQFDIIDSQAVLGDYKLVILPDCIGYNERLETVLKEYIQNGGKVLGSYDSCIQKDGQESIYGVRYVGESPYYREFMMPNEVIGKLLPKEEFVMYLRGYDVEADSAQILMNKIEPYFERAGVKFCSHQHAPSSWLAGAAEVTKKDGIIYFAHPIFHLYRKNAARWCKLMVQDAIEILLDQKYVSHNGPSTLTALLNVQEKENREILHLLHYITEKRSEDIYTIEDVIPLFNIQFKLHTGRRKVKAVLQVPENISVSFECAEDSIYFDIDKIEGHRMVSIQY